MECVAITRGGRGSAWLFGSREEAELHPLVQPGDAVMADRWDMFKQYLLLDLNDLLLVVGNDDLRQRVLASVPARGSIPDRMRLSTVDKTHGAAIWAALVKSARPVPRDPAKICQLIREDRIKWKEEHMAKKAAAAGGAAKEGKEKAAAGTRASKDFPDNHVITLGMDKDGKSYGKDNNPKRAGTNAAAAFALYKNGMTVKKFLEAGGSLADLRNDTTKKFISVAAAA